MVEQEGQTHERNDAFEAAQLLQRRIRSYSSKLAIAFLEYVRDVVEFTPSYVLRDDDFDALDNELQALLSKWCAIAEQRRREQP
jgi:hypothetical protein